MERQTIQELRDTDATKKSLTILGTLWAEFPRSQTHFLPQGKEALDLKTSLPDCWEESTE